MKRKIMIFLYCILIICAVTGCQLAREDAGANTYEDRLIGLFVTTEYLDLFDFDRYLNDNIGGFNGSDIIVEGNTQAYEGKLYATRTTKTQTNEDTGETSQTDEYQFSDIEGFSCFSATIPATEGYDAYITTVSDPAISDGKTHINISDDANGTILEGTLYVSPRGKDRVYYLNPVYQCADGSVYALSGSGMSVSGIDSEGAAMSHTLEATTTIVENGKTKTDNISITLSISVMFTPEKIVILQMDADGKLLAQADYAPNMMPESISPEPETAYLIVETHKQNVNGSKISRDIYQEDSENIETFFSREDGVCVKRWTNVKWPESITNNHY